MGGVSILDIFLKNKSVYASTLLKQIGTTLVITILPIFLVDDLGASLFEVSMVYVTFMVVAFFTMAMMAYTVKISYLTAYRAGVGLGIFAYAGILVATEWWGMVPFMAVVGVSWGLMYVGASLHLMANNPKSTSIGIFNSILAVSSIVGSVVAGVMAFTFDFMVVTWVMVVLTAAGFGISLLKDKAPNLCSV